MSKRIYDEASKVSAEEGEVIVDGPDGVAVSFTPRAAIETSDRLHDAGVQAHGQQLRAKQSGGDAEEQVMDPTRQPQK